METASDSRFDPNIAAQILVDAAREQSLKHVFQLLVKHSAEALHVVCVQYWLVDKGDLCARCPYRAECPDQSRCLHLVAAKGKSISGSGKRPRPFENLNARVPLGVGPIGEAVAAGQERVFPDADKQPASLPGLEWLREERIRAYWIVPIRFKAETLGAGVFFGREDLPEEIGLWGRIFADHLGAAIANARAFEKIHVAGKHLEETNQRLKRELAERKETEGRLRESEHRYRRIVDTAFEGIWELDEHYTTTMVNRRMAEMLGYEPQEMAGRRFDEFLFENDLADHQMRAAARRQGLAELFERRFRRKDGSAVWMQVSATPILDAQNRFTGSFAMFSDITERKHAEEDMRASESRFRTFVDHATDAFFVHDVDESRIVDMNRQACEGLGYTREELIGMKPHDFNPGADAAFLRWIRERLEAEEVCTFETHHRRKDGTLFPVEVRVRKFWYGGRQLHLALARDITDRKQAEQEVAGLNFALDRVREAAFLVDDTGRFHYVNEAACRVLGYTRAEMLGLGVADIDPEFPAERWADHWRDLTASRSLSFESRHRTQDGHIFPVEVSANYFEYGGRAYILALVRDITERKQAEEALRRSKAYLAEAQRLSHTGSWAFDLASNKYVYVSEECLRIFELDAQEDFPNREAVSRLIHPEDWDRVNGDFEKSVREKVDTSSEFRLVLPSGTVKHVQTIRHPVLNEAGDVVELLGTTIDITERKRAEEERRQSAERFRAIADYTYDWEHWIGVDGKLLWVNPAVERITGYSVSECMAMPDFPIPIVAEADRQTAARQIREAVQGSSRNDFEFRVRHKDGHLAWVAASWQPIYDSRGARLGHRCSIRDIIERKQAEEKIRQQEAELHQVLDFTPHLVGVFGLDRKPLYASQPTLDYIGLTLEEWKGISDPFWFFHPDDREHVAKDVYTGAANNVPHEFEARLRRKDGMYRWFLFRDNPLRDEQGLIMRWYLSATDIEDRKQTEQALEDSEVNLNRAQEIAQVGSWHLDIIRNQLGWSDEVFRIFDIPRGTALSYESFLDRIHSEDRERVDRAWAAALQGAPYDLEHRILVGDKLKWVRERAEIEFDPQGKAVRGIGTVQDITERKQAEEELHKHREHLEDLVKQRTEELAEAKARSEAANREKSTFLANMSHELRTPLNAVLGFSQLLRRDPDVTPHQQESLDIIVRSGEHLLNLINNVLDMAKIESGRVVLEESEVDLQQLVYEMQSLMGVGATEKGLPFALELTPDLPRFVAVDAGKLRQVLLNLIGNAIKYTESGGVKLRAKVTSRDGVESAHVRFEVEDSGPGISQEDCRCIFFPFVQLGERVPTRAGTGLGLAICKQYVELMGGQIGVASEPGKGSVFYFTIPLRVLSSVGARDELKHGRVLGLAEGQPHYRLLIAEDQPENRLLLRRLLDPFGFELREAANGQEAVALFEQWHPDLIWMDIRMPVMDGLEAVRRIRASKTGAATKIIALTAHALKEERGPILAVGCDDLVRKPFREQELFDALARHLRLKFIYEKTPRPETTPEAPGFTLRPEQLETLPADLRQDLRQAVIELDTARTQALIEQVIKRDAALGQFLNTLATRLDYPSLLKWLEKGHSQIG